MDTPIFQIRETSTSSPPREFYRGDVAAFEAFCLEIEAPLFSYLLRLVQDRHDAQDLTQETLLRLFRMVRNGQVRRREGKPRSLAFTIAHNLAMDHHRRMRNVVALDGERVAAADRTVERVLLRKEIEKALDDLPQAHRSAIMLREFGELSYGEIAEALATNEGCVKAWIYRARKRLAQLLDRDGQYVGTGDSNASQGPGGGVSNHDV